MVEEIQELIRDVEYRLLGTKKSNIKIIDFFEFHVLAPFKYLCYGIRNSFNSVMKFLLSFIIISSLLQLILPLYNSLTSFDSIYLLFSLLVAGIFAFITAPSHFLYKKIKPKVLKDIEDLVREVVANNVNSVVYVDHIRDITKMFEVKMIDKMRGYKFVLGIFWGSIIFFYEKIINGNLIIDEYSFLLFIVIAIITWMIIESYTEANKLVFLYLDMAVLNCRGKTSLNT